MNILALEVSTSSAKAMIYSTTDGIIGSYSIPYEQSVSDVATQDPDGIYNTVLKCAHNLLEQVECSIDAIGLASTWHSFLLLDKDRKPLGKIRTWADTESSNTVSKYRRDQEFSKKVYHKTGCPVHSIYPLWKWMHLKNRILLPDSFYISSKPEYIYEKLTGEAAVSKSVASGTGLMNIHNLDWDEDILEFAGLDRGQLSPLCDYDYYEGLKKNVADELGLISGIPVIITGPDGALNQIGSGALKEGIMTLSVGTSGALRVVPPRVMLPDEPSTWCYYVAEGKRLAGAATSGAGNCIDWFRNMITSNNLGYQGLENMASNIESETAPVFLPFLYGERCPGWHDSRSGGFYSLRGSHSTGDLYYSLLEGILFNIYHSYKILLEIGVHPDEIRVSGGINNSEFWLQMLADILQREITVSSVKDASTMGAVAVAEKVLGVISKIEDFNFSSGDIIKPNFEKKSLYEQRFSKYLKWYNDTI